MDHVIFLESFTYSYPPFPHTAHTIVPLKHSVLELSLGFLLQLFPNQSGKLLFVLNAERDNNTLSSSINTLVRAIVKRHRLALLPLPCKKGNLWQRHMMRNERKQLSLPQGSGPSSLVFCPVWPHSGQTDTNPGLGWSTLTFSRDKK